MILCLTTVACTSADVKNEKSGSGDENIAAEKENNEEVADEEATEEETTVETEPAETYYAVGDTVSTNMFIFTLDAADFAIALERKQEAIGLPKEYDPAEDNNNPYVAQVGHVLAAITYTVENVSRKSNEFHDGKKSFVSVRYKDSEYSAEYRDCGYYLTAEKIMVDRNAEVVTLEPYKWYSNVSTNFLLSNGEKTTRRGYADIAVEPDALTDAFYLRITIPSSSGPEVFTYYIPER